MFHIGEGAAFQPDYFMDEDVVLVSMNYRLGPLGRYYRFFTS
jgi:carboxylesterase type B